MPTSYNPPSRTDWDRFISHSISKGWGSEDYIEHVEGQSPVFRHFNKTPVTVRAMNHPKSKAKHVSAVGR